MSALQMRFSLLHIAPRQNRENISIGNVQRSALASESILHVHDDRRLRQIHLDRFRFGLQPQYRRFSPRPPLIVTFRLCAE